MANGLIGDKKLTTLDEMFGTVDKPKEAQVNEINIDMLIPFEHHPFKLYQGERHSDMVNSIREFGVLAPIIVRTIGFDKYEILSGHNRWNAAKEVGLEKVPAVIMSGLSDDEAMLVVTESNLIQRSFTDLAHSERAFILAEHHNALKKQGKRMDLINEVKLLLNADEIRDDGTCSPGGNKLKSMEKTGESYGLSKNTVARYLRINELISDIKELIDLEDIGIKAGVELSYLSEDNQNYLIDILNSNNYKIDIKIASELRSLEKDGKLNEHIIENVLSGKYKPKASKLAVNTGIKVKSKILKKYFKNNQDTTEIEEIIDKALAMYYENMFIGDRRI